MVNQPKYLVIEKGEDTLKGKSCLVREFETLAGAYDCWKENAGKRMICKEIELEVVEKI